MHRCITKGHRGLNLQPVGSFLISGGSPVGTGMGGEFSSPFGIDASNVFVYGCRGSISMSSVCACSMILPAYITYNLLQNREATSKS